MLSFQLMSRRYERASTVLTSNKGFEEWVDIFGDDVMAAALIDRLVHHCHLVTIRSNSYRMPQHTELWQTLHATQDLEPAAGRGTIREELRDGFCDGRNLRLDDTDESRWLPASNQVLVRFPGSKAQRHS